MRADVIAVLTAVVPVLAAVGGSLRYLVRILAQIERVTDLAQHTAEALDRHLEQSAAVHAALTDRVAAQSTSIAVLQNGTGPKVPSQ